MLVTTQIIFTPFSHITLILASLFGISLRVLKVTQVNESLSLIKCGVGMFFHLNSEMKGDTGSNNLFTQ